MLDENKCIGHITKILDNDPILNVYQIFIQNVDKHLDGELGTVFVIKFLAMGLTAKKCIYYQLHLRQIEKFGCVRDDANELIELKKQIKFSNDVIIIRENNYCVEKIWLPYDIWGDNKREIEIL
jgi:hypothetical protein